MTADKPRSFAFIRFSDADSANKCLGQKVHVVHGHACVVDKVKTNSEVDLHAQGIAKMTSSNLK